MENQRNSRVFETVFGDFVKSGKKKNIKTWKNVKKSKKSKKSKTKVKKVSMIQKNQDFF